MSNLTNKVVFVTGGSRGIGAAIAKRLAADGASVAITYTQGAEAAAQVVSSIEASGGKALAIRADATDAKAVTAAVDQAVATFGKLDVLVNNAGTAIPKPFEETSLEELDHVIAINVRGVFIATQAALKHLKDGGRIISIGSCVGERMMTPGLVAYAATKAAVKMFTQGLAREVGARGITVNTIQPGPIDTELNPAASEWAAPQLANTALKRYGHVDDIAAMVAFVAGPEFGLHHRREPHRRRRHQRLSMTAMPDPSGKTALVTGASRGIGRAAALALAQAGAEILVHYGRNAEEAAAVADQIRVAGGRAQTIGVDLAAAEGPAELARQVRAIVGERLDILVANAGVSSAATIEAATMAEFDAMYAVNVRAPFFLVQQLLPVLQEGSSVIFVSSLAAHAAVGTLSAYAATKGAIDTLVKHVASALGPRGIRVNAVAPGVVATDMSSFTRTDAGRQYALDLQALKRIAQPDDIAGAIAFLGSDAARWITGDTLRVDGGSRL